MPNDHDIVRISDFEDGSVVECACSKRVTALSAEEARSKHAGHYGVEQVRAEMRRITDGS